MNKRLRLFEKQCWDKQTNHLNTEKFASALLATAVEFIHADYLRDYDMSSRESLLQALNDHFGIEL